MTTPDLLLLPYRYKTSKLYSIIPSDGSGDFAFTRAVAANRVNGDGNTESMAINVPRIDYAVGSCPYLLIEENSGNPDLPVLSSASSLIGQTQGTIFFEVYWNVAAQAGSPIAGIVTITADASNLNNCLLFGIERLSGGINRFYVLIQSGGATTTALIGANISSGVFKAALVYQANNYKLFVNGVLIASSTSGAMPIGTLSTVLLGHRFTNDSVIMNDRLKTVALYKTILSDEELISMTTL